MSLVNTTTWATVSLSTIKATPIWKSEEERNNGKIPHDRYNSVIKAALVTLGMNERSHFSMERNVNIRSNEDRSVVFANTTLYTFPVESSCPFIRVYQKNDILHFGEEDFEGWGVSHIKMEDFGNEYDPSRKDGNDF